VADKAVSIETPRFDMAQEMETISKSLTMFNKLPPDARERAYLYLGSVLGLAKSVSPTPPRGSVGHAKSHSAPAPAVPSSNIRYGSLAELYNAARPETGAHKVLVGGYWLQVCNQQAEFTAQAVNDGLKDTGARVANVTVAFNTLKAANPSLVLQVRKSGKAQQARKQYRLTVAGIRAVEDMIKREE
jgi:hypothetical protein